MKKQIQKTLNKFNDSESGLFEAVALLGFLYFIASLIVRA